MTLKSGVRGLLRKAALLLRRAQFREELDEEIAFHRAQAEVAFVAGGMSEVEARRAAARQFGNAALLKERSTEAIGFRFETIVQDLRYGLGTLRRTPAFTATAILTLALGIGACTAIFSLVNAVLLRSLPYGDPSRLVYLFTPNPNLNIPSEVMSPSYGDLNELRKQTRSYERLTTFSQATFSLISQNSGRTETARLSAAQVDANFFSTLQSTPTIGRAIDAADIQPGRARVAILSHALWQSQFAADPGILNRSINLDGTSYHIVGVMPPAFNYPTNFDLPYGISTIKATDIWTPLVLTAAQQADHEPSDESAVIGRLRPGATVAQAQAEMSTIMARLDPLHSAALRGWGALVKPFLDNAIGPVRPLMRLLLAAVVVVLLIACGNAANLLLARASGRMKELGIRVALGAGRRRVIRQLLTESLLIGVAAGAIGIALAALFLRLLPHLDPGNIPRLNQASLDSRVLLFTIVISVLTSLLTGILPALAVSRANLVAFLASGNNGNTAHGSSQGALIVAETALVVVLLSCAGLLLRSYINVASVATGFSPSTLTMHLWLDAAHRQPQAERTAYCKSLLDKLNAVPGVSAAGAISNLPLSNSESVAFFWVEGYPNRKNQLVQARSATSQYFAAMNIPLLSGRLFTESDLANPRLTIVNQRFARTYLANRNPIGARISTDDAHQQWDTVIGVVGDIRHTSLEADPEPQIYHLNYDFDSATVAVRSALPPSVLIPQFRAALTSIDPGLTLTDIHTMANLISEASARRRFQTSLLTAFAAIALFLAMIGLYGLMAYSVTRRTQEMGIRMALGAQKSNVTLLILKNAATLLGSGLVLGLLGAWIATRAIQSFLFGLSGHDPVTLLSVCAMLAACGFLAAYLPARRAASIDPMQALRAE